MQRDNGISTDSVASDSRLLNDKAPRRADTGMQIQALLQRPSNQSHFFTKTAISRLATDSRTIQYNLSTIANLPPPPCPLTTWNNPRQAKCHTPHHTHINPSPPPSDPLHPLPPTKAARRPSEAKYVAVIAADKDFGRSCPLPIYVCTLRPKSRSQSPPHYKEKQGRFGSITIRTNIDRGIATGPVPHHPPY